MENSTFHRNAAVLLKLVEYKLINAQVGKASKKK